MHLPGGVQMNLVAKKWWRLCSHCSSTQRQNTSQTTWVSSTLSIVTPHKRKNQIFQAFRNCRGSRLPMIMTHAWLSSAGDVFSGESAGRCGQWGFHLPNLPTCDSEMLQHRDQLLDRRQVFWREPNLPSSRPVKNLKQNFIDKKIVFAVGLMREFYTTASNSLRLASKSQLGKTASRNSSRKKEVNTELFCLARNTDKLGGGGFVLLKCRKC